MKNVNVTPVAEATAIVSNAPSAVVKARGEAVAVSVQVDQINRVGHAANRVYGEQFALWAFQLAPSVKWHEMTVDQLKAANKELFAEAKAFRSEYVTSNISKVWSDIKGYAADFIKKTPLCAKSTMACLSWSSWMLSLTAAKAKAMRLGRLTKSFVHPRKTAACGCIETLQSVTV
jgi:hypothetical protein